jgi:hypothetical protein
MSISFKNLKPLVVHLQSMGLEDPWWYALPDPGRVHPRTRAARTVSPGGTDGYGGYRLPAKAVVLATTSRYTPRISVAVDKERSASSWVAFSLTDWAYGKYAPRTTRLADLITDCADEVGTVLGSGLSRDERLRSAITGAWSCRKATKSILDSVGENTSRVSAVNKFTAFKQRAHTFVDDLFRAAKTSLVRVLNS